MCEVKEKARLTKQDIGSSQSCQIYHFGCSCYSKKDPI